jgi:hypothetical protein
VVGVVEGEAIGVDGTGAGSAAVVRVPGAPGEVRVLDGVVPQPASSTAATAATAATTAYRIGLTHPSLRMSRR